MVPVNFFIRVTRNSDFHLLLNPFNRPGIGHKYRDAADATVHLQNATSDADTGWIERMQDTECQIIPNTTHKLWNDLDRIAAAAALEWLKIDHVRREVILRCFHHDIPS